MSQGRRKLQRRRQPPWNSSATQPTTGNGLLPQRKLPRGRPRLHTKPRPPSADTPRRASPRLAHSSPKAAITPGSPGLRHRKVSFTLCLKVRGYSSVRAPFGRGRAGASRALPGRTRGEERRMRRCLRTWMTSSLRSAGVGSWHVGVRMRSLPLRAPKQGSAQLEFLHTP